MGILLIILFIISSNLYASEACLCTANIQNTSIIYNTEKSWKV